MMPNFGQSMALPDPVLETLEVKTPGSFFVQNRDTAILSLIFGPVPASLVTPLVPGAVSAPFPGFTGPIQVIGPTGTAFDATAS